MVPPDYLAHCQAVWKFLSEPCYMKVSIFLDKGNENGIIATMPRQTKTKISIRNWRNCLVEMYYSEYN